MKNGTGGKSEGENSSKGLDDEKKKSKDGGKNTEEESKMGENSSKDQPSDEPLNKDVPVEEKKSNEGKPKAEAPPEPTKNSGNVHGSGGDVTKDSSINAANAILDLLGMMKISVIKNSIVKGSRPLIPMEEMASEAEDVMEIVESVDPTHIVIHDVCNNKRYFRVRLSDKRMVFKNLDELISEMLRLYNYESTLARKVLREPSRIFFYKKLVYDPTKLGYPLNDLLLADSEDDAYREVIENSCSPEPMRRGFVPIKSFSSKRVSRSRLALQDYSRRNMPQVRDDWNLRARIINTEEESISNLFRPIGAWEFLHPVCPIMNQDPFDGLLINENLRVEFIVGASAPIIELSPISSSDLLKSASTSATRPTYINSLVNVVYSDYMGEEIAMYVNSLLCPGSILFEIDYDDITNDAVELKGFISLIAKAVFFYDAESNFSNILHDSMHKADLNIIDWLRSKDIITNTYVNNGPFPLDSYVLRRNLAANRGGVFDYFKTMRGTNGMNVDRRELIIDRVAQEFYPLCSARVNYAVDYDDYRNFERDGRLEEWNIIDALFSIFNRSTGMQNWADVTTVCLRRFLHFLVRMNEYNRTNWQTIFRESEGSRARRLYDDSESYAIKTKIRATTILYMLKSMPNGKLRRKVDLWTKWKIESSFEKRLVHASLRLALVRNVIAFYGEERVYGKKSIAAIVSKDDPVIQYIFEHATAFRNEDHFLRMIERGSVNEVYAGLYRPLINWSNRDLMFYGVIPRVILEQKTNRLVKEFLEELIFNEAMLTNFGTDSGLTPIAPDNIRRMLSCRSLNAELFNSCIVGKLIKLFLPYEYVSELSKLSNVMPLADNGDYTESSIRKRLVFNPVKVYSVELDKRKFIYPDDYTPVSLVNETTFIPASLREELFCDISHYFSNISRYINPEYAISKEKYTFTSLFNLDL